MAEKTEKKYIGSVGRRKTSVARVRLTPASKMSYVVNSKSLSEYFNSADLISTVESPIQKSETGNKYQITVRVMGGGISSQAEAIRLGISRCLVKENQELRKGLKKLGFLKRDPRSKERKKPGLKKARKRPQWSKR